MPMGAPLYLLSAGILFLSGATQASQFVLTYVSYEHSVSPTVDSHYRVAPNPGTPSDWLSPVNYANGGTAFMHLEVDTKPSNAPTIFQICFEATPSYACTSFSPVYTTPGVY